MRVIYYSEGSSLEFSLAVSHATKRKSSLNEGFIPRGSFCGTNCVKVSRCPLFHHFSALIANLKKRWSDRGWMTCACKVVPEEFVHNNNRACLLTPINSFMQISYLRHGGSYLAICSHDQRSGWWGGSIGRASDSRSKALRFKSRQEHKKKIVSFSKSKLLRWLAVGVPNPCVHTHSQDWSHTHVIDPVVHVRVLWITETRKDPACTLLTGG